MLFKGTLIWQASKAIFPGFFRELAEKFIKETFLNWALRAPRATVLESSTDAFEIVWTNPKYWKHRKSWKSVCPRKSPEVSSIFLRTFPGSSLGRAGPKSVMLLSIFMAPRKSPELTGGFLSFWVIFVKFSGFCASCNYSLLSILLHTSGVYILRNKIEM